MSGAFSLGAAGGAVIEMLIVVCACALPPSDRAIAKAVAAVRISEAFREPAVFISTDIAAQAGVRGSKKRATSSRCLFVSHRRRRLSRVDGVETRF